VRHGAKGESNGIGIEGISARYYCMVCVEIWRFEYLNLERCLCCENCEGHETYEIREIREGHDVKSSTGFEGVVLVRVPQLNMKGLRIEQKVQHENGLPSVLTVHKCSHEDRAGQGIHTVGGSFTNTKFIGQDMGLIYHSPHEPVCNSRCKLATSCLISKLSSIHRGVNSNLRQH
jgi:hypothetical protein